MRILFLLTAIALAICGLWSCKSTKAVSVRKFGAKGDGLTDDTKALQQAIDAAKSSIVLEPRKKYRIQQPLKLHSNLTVEGNGSTLIAPTGSQLIVLELNRLENVELNNLKITGSFPDTTKLPQFTREFLVKCDQSNNIRFNRVQVSNHAYSGIKLSDVTNVQLIDCHFSNFGYPFYSGDLPNYSYDAVIVTAEYAQTNGVVFDKCTFSNIGNHLPGKSHSDGDGIHIQAIKAEILHHVKVTNCTFAECSARGIKAQSGSQIQIADNKFIDCTVGVGISMVNDMHNIRVEHNQFTGCYFALNTNAFQRRIYADNVTIQNNTGSNLKYFLQAHGDAPLRNSAINDNTIDGLDFCFMDAKFVNTQIERNKVSNYARKKDPSYYMALLVNDSDNVKIAQNEFSSGIATHCAIYLQSGSKNVEAVENKITLPATPAGETYIIHFSNPKDKKIARNKVQLKQ